MQDNPNTQNPYLKKDSIYISMLKKGVEKQDIGISYHQMTEFLVEKCNYELIGKTEDYLITWFFENFYEAEAEAYRQKALSDGESTKYDHYKKYMLKEAIIKGDAYMKYVDYLELTESRKSSKQAATIAIIAIIISALFAFIQILGG
jgi:hypothetical protein